MFARHTRVPKTSDSALRWLGRRFQNLLLPGEVVLLFTVVLVAASPACAGRVDGRSHACAGDIGVPLTIDLSPDVTQLVIGRDTSVVLMLSARADLQHVQVRITVSGGAELTDAVSSDYEFLALGETVRLPIPFRLLRTGLSTVTADVSAEISGTEFPFAKRVALNVLLDEDRVLAGKEVPRHLRIRAVSEQLQEGRITQEQADAALAPLMRLEGVFDQGPISPVERTPQEKALLDQLTLPPEEKTVAVDEHGVTLGSVTLRVMGLVQWQDENGSLHPVYGMTVQVRDDDTVGSENVWSMATDVNGQYDTGFFAHDDGFGAGNPDIFVRFRTENSAIDVEDGCFACGTYQSDSATHDEFPGGTIVENFTCGNTGTGPSCSVLTGLTWIAHYTAILNNNNFLDRIRADWPGDSGSSNYNCPLACRINVQPGDRWDWDVLHHEYGHYVMDEFDFEDNPGGEHFINACASTAREDKDEGIRLAWGEGWATYFGTAGQHRLNMASFNVPRVGDAAYSETEEANFTYSLEDNTGGLIPDTGLTGRGEDSELAVQRVFWDLYDSHVDSRDLVDLSDQYLFDFVALFDPHSLSAAWSSIRPSLSNELDLAFGAVSVDHEIGPRCVSPPDGTEITLSNATFSWDPNVGCDTSFAGNSFDLVFYRAIDHADAMTIPGLTVSTYTLSASEYQQVRAWGPELIWAVEARNTASPSTGPYLGDHRTVFMYVTPSNDACANARVIGEGSVIGTTHGASADGSDSCIVSSREDVWFAYTATCTGPMTVDTCGSDVTTSISVHQGCPGTFNNELDCGNGLPCADQVRVSVEQGQTYLVRAATASTVTGNFTLNLTCVSQADDCAAAAPVSIGTAVSGTTIGATVDTAPTCEGFDVTAPGVWYTVIGTGTELTASLCDMGTNYDSKLSVYCGGCGNLQCRRANDDACSSTKSEVTWCSTPGAVHHILVHGYSSNTGNFNLEVTDTGTYCGPLYSSCAPANNTCSTATELGTGNYVGDNTSTNTSATAACGTSNGDVWYFYTPNCNGFIRISTCGGSGSLADTVLSVYDTCGGRELACNDDFAECGLRSQVTVPVYADEPIWIRVADYGSTVNEGTFPLSITGTGMIAPLVVHSPGLYVAEGSGAVEDHLFRIPRAGDTAQTVGPLGVVGASALAYAEPLGLLYGIDDAIDSDSMIVVDPATGAATMIGNLVYQAVQALAFDPYAHWLYASDVAADVLIRVDPFSGDGASVGQLGFDDVRALAFHAESGLLFGSDVVTDQLLVIDPNTGNGSAIGPFGAGFGQVEGLAFDPLTQALYAVNRLPGGDGQLLTVNPSTGSATLVATHGSLDPQALTILPGLPDARIDEPYQAPVPVAGGCPSYFLGDATGLPAGLELSTPGQVLGAPEESGQFQVQFTAADSNLSSPPVAATLPLRVYPANDACDEGFFVGRGVTPFDTRGASTEVDYPTGPCESGGDQNVPADIWFCYVADCEGEVLVSLCNSAYDTKLAVYPVCDCPPVHTPIACDDDGCGSGSVASKVTFQASPGEEYLIRVGGYVGATGSGELFITCAECTSAADCQDGTMCTMDSCVDGRCVFIHLSCADGDPCTIDDCDAATGCVNVSLQCDDEDACTVDYCDTLAGSCMTSPLDCDDQDACTIDTCDPGSGCVHALLDCDSDDECDLTDNCPTVWNPDQANADGDTWGDACDGPHDADHDGDVDADDLHHFGSCMFGPAVSATPECLPMHDANSDLRLDLVDFARLQRMFTGAITSPCDE